MDSSKTAITQGIKITVNVVFRDDISDLESDSFFFNYEIQIQNCNDFDVQLIHRNWYIFDSLNEINLVSGEGVIGETPILRKDEVFSYVSGCELYSEVGYMKGYYTFKNLENEQLFQVLIPKFNLEFPGKLN